MSSLDSSWTAPSVAAPSGLASVNRRFYERLWRGAYFIGPERFNTWPLVQGLVADAGPRLEVGPGLRPRLPIDGTDFLDISPHAVAELGARGGRARCGDAADLPYKGGAFDLVCALDIIEHIEDPDRIFAELTRVLRPGGTLLLAVPLHPGRWTAFDTVVGHAHRFSPDELLSTLARHGLVVDRSAPYGMQTSSTALANFTASGFTHMPRFTIFLYNFLVMPLGLARQKPLRLQPGLIDTRDVDELLLICQLRTDG